MATCALYTSQQIRATHNTFEQMISMKEALICKYKTLVKVYTAPRGLALPEHATSAL